MHLDPDQLAVLNVVALKKATDVGAIAAALDVPSDLVDGVVAALAEAGVIASVGGMLFPTNDADPVLQADADQRYAGLRASSDADDIHERFEAINGRFLKAMTAWQRVEVGGRTIANDHTDAAYDQGVLADIARLTARFGQVADRLAQHDPRFTRYRVRMEQAMGKVDLGDQDFIVSPTVDSVHNVWFEFHEDLLRTLGRPRRE